MDKFERLTDYIWRIETDLGTRFMAQYLLAGSERTVLFDTGLSSTPDEALIPALEQAGLEPDLIVISHADLDHCGGNRRMRERYPRALLACPERDRRWIESNALMLAENYLWHEPYGFEEPGAEERRAMLAQLGGDAPVDVGLCGGETLRLGGDQRLEILHLPGHTPGHVGLWDPRQRIAIVIDAVLSDGVYDRSGRKLVPPRYYDAGAYRETIRRVRELEPELLLTAHYPPCAGPAAREFCERSLAYVDDVEAVVAERYGAGDTDLRRLTEEVNRRLGPFSEFTSETAAGVRSHLAAIKSAAIDTGHPPV